MAYFRIKNTGSYPIRLVKIWGQTSTANESQSGPLTNVYIHPGEEVCFGHWAIPSGVKCNERGVYFFAYSGSGYASTHTLYGAKTVCNSDGTGQLIIPGFGFEYVQYVEGQALTKKQIGSKELIIKCVGKT